MRILYDYQTFYLQKIGGISNSFTQLIKNMPDDVDIDISLSESDNIHLRDSSIKSVPSMKGTMDDVIVKSFFRGKGRLYRAYSKILPNHTALGRNQLCSIHALKEGVFDVFHPTFFDGYFLPYLNGKPFVLTVHDMTPEIFGGGNRNIQIRMKPILCKQAAHIIAVSENTKKDLIELLNIPESKVTVIYHGAPESIIREQEPICKSKYILYVGQRCKYKCFNEMLIHIAPILLSFQDLKLVCAGTDFSKEEQILINRLGVSDSLIITHPTDSELMNLYANALCFIFPSVYEGFGIPILEAYKAGCPVLLNDQSCFPEIAQNAAVWFHLDKEHSNLTSIMSSFLMMSAEERQKLIDRQYERLKVFSWKESALKLAKVYKSIIS